MHNYDNILKIKQAELDWFKNIFNDNQSKIDSLIQKVKELDRIHNKLLETKIIFNQKIYDGIIL